MSSDKHSHGFRRRFREVSGQSRHDIDAWMQSTGRWIFACFGILMLGGVIWKAITGS